MVDRDTRIIYKSIYDAIDVFREDPLNMTDKQCAFDIIYDYAERIYIENGGQYDDFCFDLICTDIVNERIEECIDTNSYLAWLYNIITL